MDCRLCPKRTTELHIPVQPQARIRELYKKEPRSTWPGNKSMRWMEFDCLTHIKSSNAMVVCIDERRASMRIFRSAYEVRPLNIMSHST